MKILTELSIRARITIGTLLVAALFFGGVGLVVHHQVEGILRDALVDVLKSDAAPFETAIQQEPDETIDNPGEGQLVAVTDPTGTTRASSLPGGVTTSLDQLDLGRSDAQEIVTPGGSYLAIVERVASGSGDWTIIAARNQDASKLVLDQLTIGLIIGLSALAVLFGAVSWLLTGAALRPVTRLRTSADALMAGPSDEMLPVGPAKDEIAELATTLNHLISDLRASAARERQMVSDASHELRTPLAVLQAQLELLGTGDAATLERDIHGAQRATARLTRLVESLLVLSRLDAHTDAASTQVAELVEEAGEAIDRARLRATSDHVDVELVVAAAPQSRGDVAMPVLLYGRVLDNLLSNALNAVEGSGRIDVRVVREDDLLVTIVTDDGPGVSEDFLPFAFDRFSQEDSARAGAHGSGLGLAIVTAAASAAGGTVSLANTEDSGAIVTLKLPIR